jgi:hypothetical protein
LTTSSMERSTPLRITLFICFLLFLIYNLGIHLSGSYIGMPQHFANGINVRSSSQLKGSVAVPKAMESDRLRKEKQR